MFQSLEDHIVETYFQDLVIDVEESMKNGLGCHANYLVKLNYIYSDILKTVKGGVFCILLL